MAKLIYDFINSVLIGNFEYGSELAVLLTCVSITLIFFVLIKLIMWLFGIGRNSVRIKR